MSNLTNNVTIKLGCYVETEYFYFRFKNSILYLNKEGRLLKLYWGWTQFNYGKDKKKLKEDDVIFYKNKIYINNFNDMKGEILRKELTSAEYLSEIGTVPEGTIL